MAISFCIVTISHQRPDVLRLFCASINRLRRELNVFIPCVCVGDPWHVTICEQYHIHFIPHENHPASRKWNIGVDYAMSIGASYVVITGSDDILSTELMRNLISAMDGDYDLIGIQTIYFYAGDGKQKGQLKKLTTEKSYGFGVARTISKELIKATGTLWTGERSWGMDGDCMKNLIKHLDRSKMKMIEGVVVDVKNKDSLNKFSFWNGKISKGEDPQTFYSILSEEEKQLLMQI